MKRMIRRWIGRLVMAVYPPRTERCAYSRDCDVASRRTRRSVQSRVVERLIKYLRLGRNLVKRSSRADSYIAARHDRAEVSRCSAAPPCRRCVIYKRVVLPPHQSPLPSASDLCAAVFHKLHSEPQFREVHAPPVNNHQPGCADAKNDFLLHTCTIFIATVFKKKEPSTG